MTIAEQRARLDELMNTAAEPPARPPLRRNLDGMRQKEVAEVEPESRLTGEFTAKISDWQPDRQGERFAPGAFDAALAKLRKDGRPIPVLYGHDQASVQAVLGSVMPDDLHALDDGLYARGFIDVTTDVGKKLHDMLRRDVLAWSVGFSLARSHTGSDGVRVLDEVDELLELSAVPVPANARTSTLSAKGHDEDEPPSHTEVERTLIEAGIISRPADRQAVYEEAKRTTLRLFQADTNGDQPEKDLDQRRRYAALTGRPESVVAPDGKGLEPRRKNTDPIRIASFPVD